MELQLALLGIGNYNRTFRQSDAGTAFRARLREKDAVPVRAAGGDIVYVEDEMRETLVKDTGLNLKRNLRGEQTGLGVAEGLQRARREPGSYQKGEGGTKDGDDAHRKEDALAADAEGRDSDDFAVHGHAAEADEDGHRNGEDEKAWEDAEEEFGDLGAGAGAADEQFHETN